MSDTLTCNRCALVRMEQKAAERGTEIVLDRDKNGWVTARYADEDKPAARFMEMPESCVC